jgi:hypothetical protein
MLNVIIFQRLGNDYKLIEPDLSKFQINRIGLIFGMETIWEKIILI